jgi:hypothetical protein
VRRVDLFWMVCHQRRNQVAEIIVAGGLRILREEWRGINVRITGAFGVRLFLH